MKTQNQRMLQRMRNSDLRAAKAWRGQQRATYPRSPSPLFQHSPGDAAERAFDRQQVRREARKEAKRRLGRPATVAARQLRLYKAELRAQRAA